ncbi:MAG: hypothetical protein ACD_74C00066G0002 [uncultured bacterium]|nr:MAG: hypothetical protein ACD_74C00066G0002 [uncultured bacterium]
MIKSINLPRKSLTLAVTLCCLFLFLGTNCRGSRQITEHPPPAIPVPEKEKVLFITSENLNVRVCPGLDCRIETTINRGKEVIQIDEKGEWLKIRIKANGIEGWLNSRFVSVSPPEPQVLPPQESGALKPQEEWATPDKETNPTPSPPVVPAPEEEKVLFINAGLLNVRVCPRLNCRIETTLKRGEEVIQIDEEGEWLKIRINAKRIEGWLNSRYVSASHPEPRVVSPQGRDTLKAREEWATPGKETKPAPSPIKEDFAR